MNAITATAAVYDPKKLDELVMIYARAADGIGCERGSFLYDEISRGLTMVLIKLAGWQAMDSAPKDRFILLYCAEDNSRWLAKWQGERWYGVDDNGLTREGHTAGDPEVVTGWEIFAWMDLPSAPFTQKS